MGVGGEARIVPLQHNSADPPPQTNNTHITAATTSDCAQCQVPVDVNEPEKPESHAVSLELEKGKTGNIRPEQRPPIIKDFQASPGKILQ